MTLSIMVTTAKEDISAITDCSTLDAAWPLLRRLKGAELSSTQLLSLGRKLETLLEEPQLRTAYLGNFVLDTLPSYVSVYAACEGIACGSYVGAYNPYFQEILDPSNALRHYDPHVIVAALAMRSLDAEVLIRSRHCARISGGTAWNVSLASSRNGLAASAASNPNVLPDCNTFGTAQAVVEREYQACHERNSRR